MLLLLLGCANSLIVDVPCNMVDVDVDGHPDDWGGYVLTEELVGRTPSCIFDVATGGISTTPLIGTCWYSDMDIDTSWISATRISAINGVDLDEVRGCTITLTPTEQCDGWDDDFDGLIDEDCVDDTAAIIEG